ncbi:MAG: hypothetical protein FRX49_10343 [Trebouxia sp. A1-2]|nr:MAG: hypothetical protein FRX49_10343 [Trebouxia sp. A1-2]
MGSTASVSVCGVAHVTGAGAEEALCLIKAQNGVSGSGFLEQGIDVLRGVAYPFGHQPSTVHNLRNTRTLRGLPVSKPTASAARVLPVPGSPVKRQTVPARSPFLPKPHCPINTALAYAAGRTMKRRQAKSSLISLEWSSDTALANDAAARMSATSMPCEGRVGLELFGQQNSFQASGGYAPPVEVLHPQSTSEL